MKKSNYKKIFITRKGVSIMEYTYLPLIPKPLLNDFITGRVIPFVGAGFSKNAEIFMGLSIPDWNELGKLAAYEIPDYDYDNNAIDALSYYLVVTIFENEIVFEEQRENLLTIAKKIDIIVMNNHLITSNTTLLQKYFGFQDYVYQTVQHTIQCIVQKNLVENTEKLTEYISRGKPKYARKMMRIGLSKVFDLTQEQLINKVNSLPRWQGKFNFNQDSNQIVLNTFSEVESLIDLFVERYTRSDVTDTEYDTDVKTVAEPTQIN